MLNFKEFMADAHVGEQKYLGIHRKRETDPKGTLHVEIQPSKDQKHSDYVKRRFLPEGGIIRIRPTNVI